MDVDTGSGMAGVLIYGVLHLAEQVVNVDEILLSPGVGHRQVVLLSQGVLAGGRAAVHHSMAGRLRHVLLLSGHGPVGDGEGTVEGHQGAANLLIR